MFGEDGRVVLVEGNETLGKEGPNSLLDLGKFGMDEAVAERIAGRLELLWSQAIAELMQQAARAINNDKEEEGDDERAESLDEEGLHRKMILQGSPPRQSKGWRPRRLVREFCQCIRFPSVEPPLRH